MNKSPFIIGLNSEGAPDIDQHITVKLLPLNLQAMDASFTHSSDSSLTLCVPITPDLSQHTGVAQGGVLCLIAETVASMAAALCYPPNTAVVGTSLSAVYFKGCRGQAVATAEPLSVGRSSTSWSVKLEDGEGKHCAQFIFSGKPLTSR